MKVSVCVAVFLSLANANALYRRSKCPPKSVQRPAPPVKPETEVLHCSTTVGCDSTSKHQPPSVPQSQPPNYGKVAERKIQLLNSGEKPSETTHVQKEFMYRLLAKIQSQAAVGVEQGDSGETENDGHQQAETQQIVVQEANPVPEQRVEQPSRQPERILEPQQLSTVESLIQSNTIMVFTLQTCKWCEKTKKLLNSRGEVYKTFIVDGNAQVRAELSEKTGQTTYPNIFIDGQHVGGYTQLAARLGVKADLS